MDQVPNEAELVARCKHELPHQHQAFEMLVAQYQHKVFTLCFRLTGDAASGEDLTQEIFTKVFFSLHHFEGRSAFSSWLYRIAYNHCLNFLSRQKREWEGIAKFETTQLWSGKRYSEEEDFSSKMQFILNQMRADSRSMLIMKYVLDLELNEMAGILDLSLGAVKMRLSRAREEFRKIHVQVSNRK